MSLYDPFAILGVSIVASERRIFQRYESVTAVLDPDRFREMSEFSQNFAAERLELVRQSYQDLMDSKPKYLTQLQDYVAENRPKPEGAIATALSSLLREDIKKIYIAAIRDLSELQFSSRTNVTQITPQLTDLNLAYIAIALDFPNPDEGGSPIPTPPRNDPPEFGAEAEPDEGVSLIP